MNFVDFQKFLEILKKSGISKLFYIIQLKIDDVSLEFFGYFQRSKEKFQNFHVYK